MLERNIAKIIKIKFGNSCNSRQRMRNYWQARNENSLDDLETLILREDGTISEIGQKPKSIEEIV